jgi:hypothetical protein
VDFDKCPARLYLGSVKTLIRRQFILSALLFLPLLAFGGVRFGPYEALLINSDVIRGVKVEESGEIWLLLNPDYRERELVVKISNEEGASYREWHHGGYELVSPPDQGKQANQWTDWIKVNAPYIEYWMSGQLVLHLKKVE